jgi:hypothetical protein
MSLLQRAMKISSDELYNKSKEEAESLKKLIET